MDLSRMLACRPSPRQLAWQQMEFYGFVHFTVNTFTDREWGDGTEDPKVFAPSAPDFCRQWARAARSAGMSGLILTAKHHDGFCLWPSRHTEHSVARSSVSGRDIVREFTDACRGEGLKAGLYLSPWDRHDPRYGTGKPYDDYYVAQLEELTGNYGLLFCIWLDGACGEGPNGKKQVYDFERYYEVVRRNQPDACICISGPDVRWCGNEAGKGRPSEFSVIRADYPGDSNASLEDLGSRTVLGEDPVRWYPAEVDTSIHKGWFYHEEEKPRTLEDLRQVWLSSAGSNSCLLLNLPPDRRGLFREDDVERLAELGSWIREMKGNVLASGEYETRFAPARVTHVTLHEDIAFGQRIEQAAVQLHKDGEWFTVARVTTVGYQKVVVFDPAEADGARLLLRSVRGRPFLLPFTVHGKSIR